MLFMSSSSQIHNGDKEKANAKVKKDFFSIDLVPFKQF
jgi:hypothetical protein